MTGPNSAIDKMLASLQERAKELNCLYRVDEALADPRRPLEEVCRDLAEAIPPGWQYPEICAARVEIGEAGWSTERYASALDRMHSIIKGEDGEVGSIAVAYTEPRPPADEGPFLKEERKLLDSIAHRAEVFVARQRIGGNLPPAEAPRAAGLQGEKEGWGVILGYLRRTDPELLRRVTRKMINRLGLLGVDDAESLLHKFVREGDSADPATGENVPMRRMPLQDLAALSEEAFRLTVGALGEEEMIASIREWIDEERSSFLLEALESPHSTLAEILDAVARHRSQIGETAQLSPPARRTVGTSLLRRVFSDDLEYVRVAREFVSLEDVYDLVDRIIYTSQGHGKLGGKTAGLFLAEQILKKEGGDGGKLPKVKIPGAWYVSSDALLEFLSYNNLRDLYFRKYMDIEHVRQEYPRIVHVLKNSNFPPEIARGLALALDDFEGKPLIVRSSSLLEDRTGSSFAGKYKSLFLPNTGRRKDRLAALLDAIAEIYASVFSPDPVEYRAERGLLDVHEEMGILIQEVVGCRVGRYFMPSFSGVALSNNEFRWSSRIRREDGLVRLVPGLGTRAVDRLGNDYPVLVAPGQPTLRVNVTADEVTRYSPRWLDALDLESGTLATLDVRDLLRESGPEYPGLRDMVSIVEEGRIRRPIGLEPDCSRDEVAVTFEGLVSRSPFVEQIGSMLDLLRRRMGRPVDIEFASDGQDLYLLQCRAQSHGGDYAPAPIPRDLPRQRVLFSARKNISNGRVPEITHVVFVDPEEYAALPDPKIMKEVARAVGRLNRILPRRQFVLMGPGRWGSRGDIRLGVPVTYADISNTAVLVEIARKTGAYAPELSFGTHFFQDLVEAEIRYIPIYPDEEGCRLNETFLRTSRSILPDILPEYSHLVRALRVIDVPGERNGKVLRILMNADLDEAVALFDAHGEGPGEEQEESEAIVDLPSATHWRWRLRMAERIAAEMDAARFGVKALYIFGSVKNGTAGPGSDIDLLIHVEEDGRKREELSLWLDGWSRSLAEMNYLRTGHRSEGLLDAHFITDQDIASRTSFASKIGAITDAARKLELSRLQD